MKATGIPVAFNLLFRKLLTASTTLRTPALPATVTAKRQIQLCVSPVGTSFPFSALNTLRVLEPAFARFVCKQASTHSLNRSFQFSVFSFPL